MIRPERIQLQMAEPKTNGSRIPATLADLIFQGPVIRCVLRDTAGTELVAHIRPEQRPDGLERGTRLWAIWDAGASCVLAPTS